jgi:tetraprenyl-beta-curcumene synthase
MADRRPARALAAVIVRYLTTIQPHAHRELARWRRRALAIPDPQLRAHVLHPFSCDRSAAGAALFAVLAPWRQQPALVRLLVAYVLLWSYVDVRTERDPHADPRLYDALLDALSDDAPTPEASIADDGGYLGTLLAACRRGCAALPSWPAVAPVALQLADDGRAVQAINHGPPSIVAAELAGWAQLRGSRSWHEECAAASSPLMIHALMALAAHADVDRHAARSTAAAYRPVSALGVLCDHLIDHAEDRCDANHSYLPYFDSFGAQASALHDLADRAVRSVRQLHLGERHAVILAAMAAMFLSRRRPTAAVDPTTASVVLGAIGPPAPQLCVALQAAHLCSPRAR